MTSTRKLSPLTRTLSILALVVSLAPGCSSEADTAPPDITTMDAGPDTTGDVDQGVIADPDLGPLTEPDGGPTEEGLANGLECEAGLECSSGTCNEIAMLGAQCGECTEDADCASGGCTLQNPYGSNGSMCNTGQGGDGCESDDACSDGRKCGTILDVLGVLEVSTCGECVTDDDCLVAGASHCVAVADTETASGQRYCLAGGSLSLDAPCDLEGNGDTHCASGQCSWVDVLGLAEVGACGECDVDTNDGCEEGESCVPGQYDFTETGALTGSRCRSI